MDGGRHTKKRWRLYLNPGCCDTVPVFRACTLTHWANSGALLSCGFLTPQLCRLLQLDSSMSNLNVEWRLLWFLTAQWLRMWASVWEVLCSNLSEGSSSSPIFALWLINKNDLINKTEKLFLDSCGHIVLPDCPDTQLSFLVGQLGEGIWTVGNALRLQGFGHYALCWTWTHVIEV